MLLRPNLDCEIHRQDGGHDRYGKSLPGEVVRARCAAVKLLTRSRKTSVRADSSASRGNAREIVADALLLFPPHAELDEGDKVVVAGIELKVIGVFPRFDMAGRLDHNEVELNVWA
jgi:hypothetical protein